MSSRAFIKRMSTAATTSASSSSSSSSSSPLKPLFSSIDNTFMRELLEDPDSQAKYPNRSTRPVKTGHFVQVAPTPLQAPYVVAVSNSMLQNLNLTSEETVIKSEDFNSAIKNLELISNSIESSENKIKAKYYYLKGLSLYQNGESDFDMQNNAIKQFKISKSLNVGDISEKSVKILQSIFNNYIEKYNSLYDNKNFTDSYKHIESAYRIYEKDTFYLYNAAIVANQAKLYKESLQHYLELVDMGYTGISMGYYRLLWVIRIVVGYYELLWAIIGYYGIL